jgi:hypothetical protein
MDPLIDSTSKMVESTNSHLGTKLTKLLLKAKLDKYVKNQ